MRRTALIACLAVFFSLAGSASAHRPWLTVRRALARALVIHGPTACVPRLAFVTGGDWGMDSFVTPTRCTTRINYSRDAWGGALGYMHANPHDPMTTDIYWPVLVSELYDQLRYINHQSVSADKTRIYNRAGR